MNKKSAIWIIIVIALSGCSKTLCGKCRLSNGQENGEACAKNDKTSYQSWQTQCQNAGGTWIETVNK